ncbi:MAG TPA: hypothetical protein VNK52_02135 [Hyphomicrobiaceae bacterium]|nr:hypothetical protein [Hyphomicrobiaceae bacterium]
MSDTKRRRGRPRGTGIDDSVRLFEIWRFHEAHPHLKPTTVIKALGYTDPSTIRRLRDKYRRSMPRAAAYTSRLPAHSRFVMPCRSHSAH